MTVMHIRLEPHPDYVGPKWAKHLREDDFEVIGCVPKISFTFSLSEVRNMPPVEDWPMVTGSGDKLLDAGVDQRFVLSEIVKCSLSSEAFGRAFVREPGIGVSQFAMQLVKHREDDPTATWLDKYIAAAQQARNRQSTHRLLGELE